MDTKQTLKEHRKRANISQEKLALECDLDRTFISLMERGLRQPSLTTIFKLADILGVPAKTLIADTQDHLGS